MRQFILAIVIVLALCFPCSAQMVQCVGGGDACTGCDYGSDSKIYDNGNTKTNELWTAYMYALFIPSGSISNDCVTGAYFYADGAGSSGSTMTCALWSNSSGSPGAIIGAGYTGTSGSLATTGCTEDEAIFATPQEAPTDDAWLVCKASAGGDIGRDASGTGTYKYSSNDGSSWSEWAYKPVMGVLGCAP